MRIKGLISQYLLPTVLDASAAVEAADPLSAIILDDSDDDEVLDVADLAFEFDTAAAQHARKVAARIRAEKDVHKTHGIRPHHTHKANAMATPIWELKGNRLYVKDELTPRGIIHLVHIWNPPRFSAVCRYPGHSCAAAVSVEQADDLCEWLARAHLFASGEEHKAYRPVMHQ